MITSIIVWGSLLAAGVFCVAYLASPRLRSQVEQPKYQFQQQLQNFDTGRQADPSPIEVKDE